MKGKNLIIFGVGATGGFIGGSIFIVSKMLASERMRKAFINIVADKTEKILFGEESHRPKYGSKVSYRGYYDSRKKSDKSYYFVEEAVFENRSDAEEVANNMRDIIDKYGCVSVADYYDLCSFPNTDYTATQYGWNNTKCVTVVRCRDGYKIKLPTAISIKYD